MIKKKGFVPFFFFFVNLAILNKLIIRKAVYNEKYRSYRKEDIPYSGNTD